MAIQPWVSAWILATFSGLSLPLGAILGIMFTPVRDEVCAAWMALGAGALLFAVTVELYGHALRELELGRAGLLEMLSTVAGALVGAFFYLCVNRWLEHSMEAKIEDAMEDCIEEDGDLFQPRPISPMPPAETTPLYRQKAPRNLGGVSRPSSSASIGTDERRRWEQIATPGGRSYREDSFSRMSNGSFAGSEDFAIKARGRDRVINRISGVPSSFGSRSPSKPRTSGSPGSPSASVSGSEAARGKHVAFALFLGLTVDGVPEGILMGVLAAEGHLSAVLIVSLFVANFPEAFSSASLMRQGGVSRLRIVGMWSGLCVGVGALAGFACFMLKHFFPSYPGGDHLPQGLLISVAVVEGITGGAMIACIASVMLPEALHRTGKDGCLCCSSGFLCTAGFLVAVVLKALEHHYNNTHGHVPAVYGHAFYLPGYGYW